MRPQSADAMKPEKPALRSFFLLAFGLTWVLLGPWFYLFNVVNQGEMSVWLWAMAPLALIGGWGPSVAAVIVTAHQGGRSAVRRLLVSLADWRVRYRWYLFVFLIPPLATALSAAQCQPLGLQYGGLLRCSSGGSLSSRSNDVENRVRMSRRDAKQNAGGPAGDSTTLLPVLEGTNTDAHERRELGLRQTISLSDGSHVSFGKLKGTSGGLPFPEDTPALADTGLELFEQVVLHLYSSSTIRRRIAFCSRDRSHATGSSASRPFPELAHRLPDPQRGATAEDDSFRNRAGVELASKRLPSPSSA